ncbi:MAG: polyprenyl synthetase family protein [Clostridia bacterium]|nr:polyprenyl synthetase family protein [Clostridia bacterium]
MIDVKSVLSENAKIASETLEYFLSEDKIGSGKLQDAMRYSALNGGKRIRASLVIEFAKLFSKDPAASYPLAAAVEMIHAFSLIHDDLPCMDDDDMRRGKQSCHIAFGEATALLAGDTLLAYAMETILGAECLSDKASRIAALAFARNSGPLGMSGGQQTDLENSTDTFEKLKKLHSMKTSALIKASCLAGYFSASCEEYDEKTVSDISEYAECVGLAFQVKDDLLDLEGDAAILGKKVGVDEKNGRVSSLSFMTPDEARTLCDTLAKRAEEVISPYDTNGFVSALPAFLNGRNK